MGERAKAKAPWPALLSYFCILLALMACVSLRTAVQVPLLSTRAQLDAFDFSGSVGKIDRNLFDFYAEKLYTPADFAAGRTGEPTYTADSADNASRQYVAYGTYRLVLSLPAGQVFALSADSATYAQKVWVNGQLLSEVGTVSADKAGFVPRTDHYTVCFTAAGGPTEIVVQRANFVHKSGALFEIDLGPQTLVFANVTRTLYRAILPLGILFAASLFFFGVSLFFPHRRQFLWFSLACLSFGIRSGFVSPKTVMILFPALDWYFGHRLECCSMISSCLFMLLFYNAAFPRAVPKAVRYTGYALCGAGLGVYALLPSVQYSALTQAGVYAAAAYLLAYGLCFAAALLQKKVRLADTPHILMAGGVLITIACSVCDEWLYRKTRDYNFSQNGMLLFTVLTSLALALQMREAEDALDDAAARERQMRQKTRELSDLYRVRSELLSDISHELKTPLTVISGYAGLTKMQLEKQAVDQRTPANLDTIQQEAVRLGALVEQLKTVSSDKNALAPVRADAAAALRRAADFCSPICEKNRNRIEVAVPDGPLYAYFVPDSLLQVLYNLITNASRHCRDSVIRLKAEKTENCVTVTVTDSGDGIAPGQLPHVFERGVSGDASTGLGLSLCRDIIENGGGTITIESAPGHGTAVTFTLPGKESTDGT